MESTSPSAEGSRPSSPSSQASSSTTTSLGSTSRRRGRDANLYDAVAGRITLNGALADASSTAPGLTRNKRRLASTASRYSLRDDARLAPEEALFRRRRAPVRYAEHDIYWADEDLPPPTAEGGCGVLPESGLLKAVHGYAARFYEGVAARVGGGRGEGGRGIGGGGDVVVGGTRRLIDERSMDETALLAFGVLLEEAAREALGRRGDLVFTEPETTMVKGMAGGADRAGLSLSNVTSASSSTHGGISALAYASSSRHHYGHGAKRRKVAATEEREVGQEKPAP